MNIKSNHFKKIILAVFFSGITVLLSAQPVHDSEIKKNVTDINTPLQKLVQLEPKVFEYNTEKYKHLKLKSGKTFGFMSDNMQQVFPELVITKHSSYMFGKNIYRDTKMKTIDEASLIPVLVASIKEQQAEIEKLKKDIKELKEAKTTVTK
jgi:hypothetical protein